MKILESAKAAGPLKVTGAALMLAASIGVMIHRMPHRHYVEAHADKPRPKPEDEAPASAAAPTPVRPVAQPSPRPAPKPAVRAPEPAPPAAVPRAEPPVEAAMATVDWTDDCRSEIGILCHDVPAKRLVRCLREYDDGLMRPCRSALNSLQSR